MIVKTEKEDEAEKKCKNRKNVKNREVQISRNKNINGWAFTIFHQDIKYWVVFLWGHLTHGVKVPLYPWFSSLLVMVSQ